MEAKQIPSLRCGMEMQKQTQIPFGNDNKKSECRNEVQIPFGDDKQKGKSNSRVKCC